MYHTSRGIQGFAHPDLPALRITLSMMNATESYLWVCPTLFGKNFVLTLSVTSEVHSRFRVGLRCVYLQRHGGWLVDILALPGMLLARKISLSLTELFDRARAISLPMSKPRNSYGDSSMDP